MGSKEGFIGYFAEKAHEKFQTPMTRRQVLAGAKDISNYAIQASAAYNLYTIADKLNSPLGLSLGEPGNLLVNSTPLDSSYVWDEKEFYHLNGELDERTYKEEKMKPERIAHRAGNTPGGIKLTHDAGIPIADLDFVTWKGGLAVSHGALKSFFGLAIGFDVEGGRLGRLKIGNVIEPEEIYEAAAKYNVRLSGEFKRTEDGEFEEKHIYNILDLNEKYKVPTKIHAKNPEIIALGRQVSERPFDWLDVPENDREWKRILKLIDQGQQIGVVTNDASVRKYAKNLQDAFVIVGNATIDRITSTYKLGVVNSYMTDISKWEEMLAAA